MMNKNKWLALIMLVLAYPAYRFGMWTMEDSSVFTSATGVEVMHFDVLSTQIGGCYLMVRDAKTRKVGELETSTGYHCPKFEAGDHVDMEKWDKSGGYTEFVFKGDMRGEEETYRERGFSHIFSSND